MTSPSLYQVISGAGLAPEALQVRLCGVWALRRTTGPPSTTGSEGGTVKQNQHTAHCNNNKKNNNSLQLQAGIRPQRSHADIELAAPRTLNNIFRQHKRQTISSYDVISVSHGVPSDGGKDQEQLSFVKGRLSLFYFLSWD